MANFNRRNGIEALAPQDLEAADWLVRLTDRDPDPEEPYPDLLDRQRAFHEWICRSPANVRAMFEILATEQRLREINVQAVLGRQSAEVIHLFGRDETPPQETPRAPPGRPAGARRPWRLISASVAAGLAVLLVGAGLYFRWAAPDIYATRVGEQRTYKLEDGSVIYLNTDSRVAIRFHRSLREIWLQRGEALFVVEHDKSRPFIVHAGNSAIQAVGTQFDVYRSEESTEVSVVEGVVQVSAPLQQASEPPAPLRLAAGERADIHGGRITARPLQNIESATSWRERRLIFTNTPLGEVARQFNRYNQSKVIVREAAQDRLHLTGIFDADRPQALIRYVSANDGLSVEQQGQNWVVQARR